MKLRSPIPPRKTRLEIIPLIDVMFFLLASFMMVSLTMTKQQTVKVKLPLATTAKDDLKPDNVTLGVTVAGDIYLGEERLPLPDLERRLVESFKKNPAMPVYISGDTDAKHGDILRAMDIARRAGFTNIAFPAKRPGQ